MLFSSVWMDSGCVALLKTSFRYIVPSPAMGAKQKDAPRWWCYGDTLEA